MDYTAKQRLFRTGVVLLPSERSVRFGNPAWPGGRTAYFAAFWPWPEALSKNAESLGTAMRSCVSLFRGVAAPLGCVIFFYFCQNCDFYALRTQGLSACARRGWYHYPQRALRVAETLDDRLSKWFICRFLASPISIYESPCRILPISALIQIACRWISRGHIACPWLIQA